MTRSQGIRYRMANNTIWFLIMISAGVMFLSHLRMGEYNSTAGEISLLFSDTVLEEHQLTENLRLVSGAILVTSVGALIAFTPKYYNEISDLDWELKKGVASGVFLTIVGGVIYLIAPDLISESLALSCILAGVLGSLIDSAYLLNRLVR